MQDTNTTRLISKIKSNPGSGRLVRQVQTASNSIHTRVTSVPQILQSNADPSLGILFVNMPATQNSAATLPVISGTSSHNAKGQPAYYNGLVYTHATLLGLAFVIVFPFGVIALRWKWQIAVRAHWIIQVTAAVAATVGFVLAITLSATGVQYSDFNQGHQVLGLIVIAMLSLQVLSGYGHHSQHKKTGRRNRTSYLHMALGRVVIYAGMVNAIL